MSNLSADKPRAAAAVVGGVVAVVVLIIGSFLIFGGNDDRSAADPGGSTPSTSTSNTPTQAATTTAADVTSSTPVPSVPYEKEARKASHDGFPPLVPSDLPAGWAVTAAEYDGGASPTWHLELRTGQGESVTVDQREASVAALTDLFAEGVDPAEDVDLSKWQIGTWKGFSSPETVAVAKALETTSVIVVGADRTAVLSITKRLLTLETTTGGEGD